MGDMGKKLGLNGLDNGYVCAPAPMASASSGSPPGLLAQDAGSCRVQRVSPQGPSVLSPPSLTPVEPRNHGGDAQRMCHLRAVSHTHPCPTYRVSHAHTVSQTPCVTSTLCHTPCHSLSHLHTGSHAPCVTHTPCHAHPVVRKYRVTHPLSHTHPVSLTPSCPTAYITSHALCPTYPVSYTQHVAHAPVSRPTSQPRHTDTRGLATTCFQISFCGPHALKRERGSAPSGERGQTLSERRWVRPRSAPRGAKGERPRRLEGGAERV